MTYPVCPECKSIKIRVRHINASRALQQQLYFGSCLKCRYSGKLEIREIEPKKSGNGESKQARA